ncbi:MAG: hypothetical protein AUK36_05890 [Zetaproteobacteria bacterium CG2_30_59_37]|nr:MAG: hypothetical protein AUK36_05890 [Zetaproteobacteria bacterium CG2_30_59_37]
MLTGSGSRSFMNKSGEPVLTPVSASIISGHYEALDKIGNLGPGRGFLRAAWSDEESAAMRLIEDAALAAGLNSRWDAVGNLIVETPGEFPTWVETGSHMDTVPGGGNYDGAAGVVAGLQALLVVHASGVALKRGLRLRVWRCEESSTFGVVSAGSRAAFGLLGSEVLGNVWQGTSLAHAIRGQGGDPRYIADGRPSIPASERDGIAACLEMHIEQGRVLEAGGFDIGVVSSIRGSVRRWVKLKGAFDHSGATPMGHAWRKDVNLAMAYMQVRLDELIRREIGAGKDIVQTIGVVNSNRHVNETLPGFYDNAVAKVSGSGYFSHEVRGCRADEVREFVEQAEQTIRQTAEEFGITVVLDEFSQLAGIEHLDDSLQTLLGDCCRMRGLRHTTLPSGAWHDAAVVSQVQRGDRRKIPVGMLFVPCHQGVSHSPAEYASPEQLAVGATVLADAMLGLAV